MIVSFVMGVRAGRLYAADIMDKLMSIIVYNLEKAGVESETIKKAMADAAKSYVESELSRSNIDEKSED
jgi:hypothetical protein